MLVGHGVRPLIVGQCHGREIEAAARGPSAATGDDRARDLTPADHDEVANAEARELRGRE